MPIPKAFQDQIPEFEKPIAAKQTFAPGNLQGAIAHVAPFGSKENTSTIFEDNPARMTSGVAAHELVHQIQRQAGSQQREPNTGPLRMEQDPSKRQEMYDQTYGYGGPMALGQLKSIGSLNAEQQANIPLDYMNAMDEIRNRPGGPTQADLSVSDAMNDDYRRPVRQLANMARPGNTIDTEPQPPGPPPAAITGMIKPLEAIGGSSMYRRGR